MKRTPFWRTLTLKTQLWTSDSSSVGTFIEPFLETLVFLVSYVSRPPSLLVLHQMLVSLRDCRPRPTPPRRFSLNIDLPVLPGTVYPERPQPWSKIDVTLKLSLKRSFPHCVIPVEKLPTHGLISVVSIRLSDSVIRSALHYFRVGPCVTLRSSPPKSCIKPLSGVFEKNFQNLSIENSK